VVGGEVVGRDGVADGVALTEDLHEDKVEVGFLVPNPLDLQISRIKQMGGMEIPVMLHLLSIKLGHMMVSKR
jgi:hypothetical protein